MSASDIRAEVASLGDYFRGDHYHLVLRNCNHFADALVERLTHRRLPAWCNRLAYMGSWVACILPKNLGVSHPDSSDVQSRSSFSSIYARSGAASFQPFAGKGQSGTFFRFFDCLVPPFSSPSSLSLRLSLSLLLSRCRYKSRSSFTKNRKKEIYIMVRHVSSPRRK
jgi:hypothetical protein